MVLKRLFGRKFHDYFISFRTILTQFKLFLQNAKKGKRKWKIWFQWIKRKKHKSKCLSESTVCWASSFYCFHNPADKLFQFGTSQRTIHFLKVTNLDCKKRLDEKNINIFVLCVWKNKLTMKHEHKRWQRWRKQKKKENKFSFVQWNKETATLSVWNCKMSK